MAVNRVIQWKIHLRSSPEVVYELLATDAGRARFWADSAVDTDGVIDFRFNNDVTARSKILQREAPSRFALNFAGTSITTFTLTPDGRGGTDLLLVESDVSPETYEANLGAWVSLLLTLKAAADHGVDLRNHDPKRSWNDGYADP